MLLVSCAVTQPKESPAVPDSERMARLEAVFQELLDRPEKGLDPDSIKVLLTDESLRWLESMEAAAISEPRDQLEARPFNELLTIVSFRMLERDGQLTGVHKDRMLYLAASRKGFLHKAMNLKLGPFEIKNDRGYRGLATSPRVPILFFIWQDGVWKLDLVSTMPVITRGVETIGVKKKWTQSHAVLYILEKSFRSQLKVAPDESLLEPRGEQQ